MRHGWFIQTSYMDQYHLTRCVHVEQKAFKSLLSNVPTSVSILKKPQLASNIDVESLGQLLPKNSQECLEKKFLSKMKVSFC